VTCEAIQKALNVIQESLSQKLPEVYEESDEVFLPLGDLGIFLNIILFKN